MDDALFLFDELLSERLLLFDVVSDLGGDARLLNLALQQVGIVSLSKAINLITRILHAVRFPREIVFNLSVAKRRAILELS